MVSSSNLLNTPEWTSRLKPHSSHQLSKVRQLYLALYEAITQGFLSDEQILPSSRELSLQLGIGRNTVIAVYSQLQDEELISTSGRGGSRVTYKMHRLENSYDATKTSSLERLSKRSADNLYLSRGTSALSPGMPDPTLFPVDSWRRAMLKATRLPAVHLGYSDSPLPELQEAIARYLGIFRSLIVEPEQIMITSSTRQSLVLAAMLYADPGNTAWIESPGYSGAVDAFRLMGLNLSPLRVDEQGASFTHIARKTPPALIYLTPCFQYPTGVPLSADRRRIILDYALKNNAVIFEDDYDSEFRDASQARPALAATSEEGTVLHAGTFSKLIFPAARVAWLVVPKVHVKPAKQCLRALGGGNNRIAQAAVAEVLSNGALAKHLQRARSVYAQRRKTLIAALETVDALLPPTDTGGSLSIVVRLKKTLPAERLSKQLSDNGIGAQFLEDMMWDSNSTKEVSSLVLGLGDVSSLAIPDTVKQLKRALNATRRKA